MDPGDGSNPIVERIVSADRPVVVVRGPAACGKTTAAVSLYRHYLDEAGRPTCLLLAPNAPAAQRLRRMILASSPGGVAVAPAVATFATLTSRVLADANDVSSPLSALARRLLLSRIVAELNAAGALPALSAVAETPGLVVALDHAIAEVKRAAVEPDDLAAAIGTARDKRTDLVAVYRRYQQELQARGAHDVEGQAWLARDCLRSAGPGKPLPGADGLDAVVADGFTDFTPTQLEILSVLAERLGRVVVTLAVADDGRGRMWHWTRRTLRAIRRRFGERLAEIELPAGAQRGGLRALAKNVFNRSGRCEAPAGLSVIAAPGLDAEVAAVARRVKARLCAGAGPGTIAVLARGMEAYGEAIRRIFREHDIPVADAPGTLSDQPIVRFVLRVASLGPRFVWRDCLGLIRSRYFRPAALGEYDERTVRAAETIIREGNVLAGRQEYAAAAERIAARARRDQPAEDDATDTGPRPPDAKAIERAGEMLGALFDLAERASEASGLASVIETLRLRDAARAHGEAELIARDLRALATLEAALAALEDPPPPIGHLRDALSAVTCPPARGESLVDVLDVLDARALRHEHVFLLGVSERGFPRRFTESSLIGEADRTRWRDRGVALDGRDDLTAREMLLFYLAVSRADKTLTVSYLESDASGQAQAPSSFLLSLLEPVGGIEASAVETISPGTMVPPPDELASGRDAFNAGISGLFARTDPVDRAALAWAAAQTPGKLRRAAMGLRARRRRWLRGECDEFDGRITDPALRAQLGRRFPGETVFSAGRLEMYGQCPWRYFATYILKLAPLAEPQRQLEPATRGTFCHNVLFRVMRLLGERLGRPVRVAELPADALGAALDEAISAEADDVEARRPPYPVLWGIQLDQMREAVLQYLLDAGRDAILDPEAMHFELAFGSDPGVAGAQDPASCPEPVTVRTSAGPVRLRGRIDRVDRVSFEDVAGLLVVDYKTGRLPTVADMAAGRSLQMPLYAAAAETLLGETCVGGAYHRVATTPGATRRLFAAIDVRRGRARYAIDPNYEDRRQAAMETVGRFVARMADGQFDALPTHTCPSYCPFRQICHYSPARAEVKTPPTGGAEEGS